MKRFFVLLHFLFMNDLIDLVDAGLEELGVASHHLIVESIRTDFADLHGRKPMRWRPLR